MVSCNSLSLALGLILTICMMTLTHSSDADASSLSLNALNEDKRTFFVGSRYGRSPQYHESKTRRFSIAPRSDRFFLGSRYGKRSDELAQPAFEQTSLDKSKTPFMMSCIYTGIKNFYRCSNSDEINDVINQLSAEENQTTN
ncbi:RYamide neuropeptides [Episyrphus balteatus]|uniref:RYamide neuropeptides n=1 Tax=Episyrphus balteatus TaxID=286459 RepID=UPI0024868401|nr:RYamide neuropeptides [Episyrphus balteatus]